MFVDNAKARGIPEEEIETQLVNQGWSKERIHYALNKSKGRGNTFYEIIPIEKLLSFFRRKKAKKEVVKNNVMIQAPVQPRPARPDMRYRRGPGFSSGNINKFR